MRHSSRKRRTAPPSEHGRSRQTPYKVHSFCDLPPHCVPAITRPQKEAIYQAATTLQPATDSADGTFPVVWDSGASVSITPSKADFITFTSKSALSSLNAVANGHTVRGEGFVKWSVRDDRGNLRTLKVKAYYVPASKVRLLSTSTLLQNLPSETITMQSDSITLSGCPGDHSRGSVTVPYHPGCNLPISMAHCVASIEDSTVKAAKDLQKSSDLLSSTILNATVIHANNLNLSEPEKELLRWHFKLGHLSFAKVKSLMRSGVLSHSEATRRLHAQACKLKQAPCCAACQYGKQKVVTSPGKVSKVIKNRAGVLRQDNLYPGQETSVDHFICSTKGRLFTSRGRTKDSNLYCGGCIFVDHASGHVHVELQPSLHSHATIAAKEAYEAYCRDLGVVPRKYLSDNGAAFTSADFKKHLSAFNQTIRYAGVGAHHHNGQAERAIQTIMSIARTMMIHSALHWPEMSDTSLWPMAVQHAVYLWNRVPNERTGLAPIDVFSRTRWNQEKLKDLHVWGSPIYILDKTIADGKKLPRWKPRSKRCKYLGVSPTHASTVPLVLNPDTGAITPQFHCVSDSWFHTVTSEIDELPDFNSDDWQKLFGDSHYQFMFEEDDLQVMRERERQESEVHHQSMSDQRERTQQSLRAPIPLNVRPPPEASLPLPPPAPGMLPVPSVFPPSAEFQPPTPVRLQPQHDVVSAPAPQVQEKEQKPTVMPSPAPSPQPKAPPKSSPPPRPTPTIRQPDPSPVSRRNPRRSTRFDGIYSKYLSSCAVSAACPPPSHFSFLFAACGTQLKKYCFPARGKNDPDTLNFDEAMRDNKEVWMKAATEEIRALEKHKSWIEVPTSAAKGHKLLPGHWVFKRKRAPDGTIKKFKARYTVRGDLHESAADTFAPVVAFSTVRLFLILSLVLKWKTCSVDFSNAFIQAAATETIYLHLPRGFHSTEGPNTCLKLLRSHYGLGTAPRAWVEHLQKALRKLGFKQSTFDPCLWFRPDIFLIQYVDDLGLAFREQGICDKFLADIRNLNFTLTVEESFNEYLGISYESLPNGHVNMTQKGLIQKIIDTAGMSDCNPNFTPAARETLGIDPEGEPMTESWSYPSIVGMMLYLSMNTRPDITFAVSQVARFNHDPKKSHATAVKSIIRYLARTKDKGTIIAPVTGPTLDMFVDADFAGLYRSDPDFEPSSAKSRMGYLIKFAGCPLLVKSCLISSICLSTAESEYYALSQGLRSLMPIKELLKELILNLDVPKIFRLEPGHSIKTTVHEDNTSALTLANDQKITNRTRHYQVRWHFFWSILNDPSNNLSIEYCSTDLQQADYLTKMPAREIFERCRKLVQGW